MKKLAITFGILTLMASSAAMAQEAAEATPVNPLVNMVDSFFNNTALDNDLNKKFLPIRIQAGYPKMDMYETKDNVVIQFEIPGIDKDKLDLQITDSFVSLKHEQKEARDIKNKNYSISERAYGSFERRVSIPSYTDSKNAEAKYENGVLNITIPKTEGGKENGRKIEIK